MCCQKDNVSHTVGINLPQKIRPEFHCIKGITDFSISRVEGFLSFLTESVKYQTTQLSQTVIRL